MLVGTVIYSLKSTESRDDPDTPDSTVEHDGVILSNGSPGMIRYPSHSLHSNQSINQSPQVMTVAKGHRQGSPGQYAAQGSPGQYASQGSPGQYASQGSAAPYASRSLERPLARKMSASTSYRASNSLHGSKLSLVPDLTWRGKEHVRLVRYCPKHGTVIVDDPTGV